MIRAEVKFDERGGDYQVRECLSEASQKIKKK